MARKFCVAIDFTGIQAYVFASNKLKDNLGASYLLENIFKNIPKHSDIFSETSINRIIKEESSSNGDEVIGYDGGGNKIMFFDTEEDAKNFVKEFSLYILTEAPGVTFASFIKEIDTDKWKEESKLLFKGLAVNKSKHPSNTVIPRHGITAECNQSGFSMDVFVESENKYVSSSVRPKLTAYDDFNKKNDFSKKYPDYELTNELDNLGQRKGHENFIAIVHIDGNDMGLTFSALNSLKETRELSAKIKQHVKDSYNKLLEQVIKDIEGKKYDGLLNLIRENNKTSLPIRSIIMGGDDITFVCEGKLGIYYAKLFMEFMSGLPLHDGEKLSTCAGIAIQNTKFPFYRGYELAEQLCSNAKAKRRQLKSKGNWFDFHISYGGFSGSLKEIRNLHYKSQSGDLYMRPYHFSIPGFETNSEFDFDNLTKAIAHFKKKDSNGKLIFPNNKIKELREVLSQSEASQKDFIKHLNARGLKLCADKTESGLFTGNSTKYLDIIELLEFYPFASDNKGGN